MIQFNSNTTDGLYCGSSNTCSAPVTTRSPFSEVHLHPTSSPPSRTRSTRVRCFSFLPSPLHHTTIRNYETVICGWRLTLISFTGEGKRMAFLHAQNTMCQRIAGEGEGWRRELRTRWVCDVHGRVRSRVRMCGWGNRGWHGGRRNGRLFKKSREEAEKRRGVSQETPLVFIPPLPILEKRNTFFIKPSTIRNWILTFTLDKTQLSFRPAVLRHPYSAKSRCFFRPSAQMFF